MKKIFVGVDESGSSIYENKEGLFILCAVVFEHESELKLIEKEIEKVLTYIKSKEIKYSKSTKQQRDLFFRKISKFKINILYKEKVILTGSKIKDIYSELLLDLCKEVVKSYDSDFYFRIDNMFSKSIQTNYIKSIKKLFAESNKKGHVQFLNSHSSFLVQVADMYAGKIRKDLLKRK